MELDQKKAPVTVVSQTPSAAAAPRTAAGDKVIAKLQRSAGGTQIKSPLPGTVMSVNCKVGDVVKAADTVVVLEAMKMENAIHAGYDGKVASITCNPGDAVLKVLYLSPLNNPYSVTTSNLHSPEYDIINEFQRIHIRKLPPVLGAHRLCQCHLAAWSDAPRGSVLHMARHKEELRAHASGADRFRYTPRQYPFNATAGLEIGIYEEGSVLNILYNGVSAGWYPPLIFLGIGAMTDFSALIANPKLMLIGAAAQFGIFGACMVALALGFSPDQAGALAIIGGADGPTAIFLSSKLAPNLMGAIAVSAYSYMALVPLIQPPIMRLLTTKKERVIRMKPARAVSQNEKNHLPDYRPAAYLLCGSLRHTSARHALLRQPAP